VSPPPAAKPASPKKKVARTKAAASTKAAAPVAPERCWLVKTEPGSYSIDDLRREGRTMWEGVRNFQARNLMRDLMRIGDPVLVYHSNAAPPGVIGLGEVVSEAHPDASSWDPESHYFDPGSSPEAPRWFCVDIGYVDTFPRLVPLEELRSHPGLTGMPLVSKSRLSVQPVSAAQFELICDLARATGG
jgi:predicted RNA-binding protein with PUA-like domain